MQVNEVQLIQNVRCGDRQAAAQLVEVFYASIYAFLRRLARNEADAADLTQKTFSRLWSALPRFAGRSSVSSWLHGIAYHVYQDFVRSSGRLESRSDEWWLDYPDQGTGPDRQAMEADLKSALFRAVDQLEGDLRDTVHLHYYQGLTLVETAQALEISASAVKYRLRMALQTLQARLADKPHINAQSSTLHRL